MLQKRTGVLQVGQLGGAGAEQGEIYFENGSLVRARTRREMGKAALQRISEWKQITCTFQSISRPPYAVTTVSPVPSPDSEVERAQLQVRPLPQTGDLARPPVLGNAGARGEGADRSFQAGERNTHPLNPRQAETAPGANTQPARSPASQPLVLHITKLEAYTPAQPVNPSRTVQRWTTHQPLEPVPPTLHVSPLPGLEALPGRLAIFKVRSPVSMAKAIHQMERHARVVFILLDGKRTIQDIARLTHRAEHEVELILVDLTQRGYTQYLCG